MNQFSIDDHNFQVLGRFLKDNIDTLGSIGRLHGPATTESLNRLKDNSKKILGGTVEINSLDKKTIDDAAILGECLDIDHVSACEFVVKNADGTSIFDKQSTRILIYARAYLHEWRSIIRVATCLFMNASNLSQGSRLDSLAVEVTNSIINKHPSFWLDIISSIKNKLIGSEPKVLSDRAQDISDELNIPALIANESSARTLQLLHLLVVGASRYPLSANIAVTYIDLAAETEAFTYLVEDAQGKPDTNFMSAVHSLGIMGVLAFLDTEGLFFDQESSYSNSPDALNRFQKSLSLLFRDSRSSAIIALSWAMILDKLSIIWQNSGEYRFSSFISSVIGRAVSSSLPNTNGDPFSTPVSKTVTTDPEIAFSLACQNLTNYAGELAGTALKLEAIERMVGLLKNLPEDSLYSDVCSRVLKASIPYLNITNEIAEAVKIVLKPFPQLSEVFFQDEMTVRALLLAKGRAPATVLPFIYFLQCFPSEDGFDLLQEMSSFLIALPENFQDYDYDNGDVVLSSDCTIIPPRQTDGEGAIIIPTGTTGKVLSSDSENHSVMVLFNRQYNGWILLFRMMELIDQGKSWDNEKLFDEMIKLLTCIVKNLDENKVQELVSISADILGYGDIIELITRRLDYALETKNVDACITGMKFMTALLPSMPQRVWPYLSRSRLLDIKGHGGMLEVILGSVELVNSDYKFTLAVIDILTALVRNSLIDALTSSISELVKRDVLNCLVKHLLLVFESFFSWRYAYPIQKTQIATGSISLFMSILQACYSINDSTVQEKKVTHILSDSSKIIIKSLLSHDDKSTRALQPLIKTIEITANGDDLDIIGRSALRTDEAIFSQYVLRFCSLLIRVRMISQLPSSLLEEKLFEQAKNLTEILDRYAFLSGAVLQLFDSLVSADWSQPSSPSLLAYLGPQHAHIFLTRLARIISSEMESSAIFQACYCISSIISGKQEGLSILLLSGRYKEVSDVGKSEKASVPLLRVLEDNIINRDNNSFAPETLAPMLDVICLAHSAWTISAGDNLSALCNSLVDLVNELMISTSDEDTKQHSKVLRKSNNNLMAARAMQILAIQLYKDPSGSWSANFLKYLKFGTNLVDISKKGFTIQGARMSLHGSLFRNFESKWGKDGRVTLDSFSRSAYFGRKRYDMRYYYDVQYMDIMLGRNPVWAGYRKDVIEANVNLSFLDSQFIMIKGWCTLLNVLGSYAGRVNDKELLEPLQSVCELAITCIRPSELNFPLFEKTNKLRLDSAYHLMLFSSKAKILKCDLKLIQQTFNMLVDPSLEFLTSLGETSSQSKLYRVILMILNLELESFMGPKGAGSENSVKAPGSQLALSRLFPIVQGIVDVIAIRGMKAIASAAQADPAGGYVEDIVVCTLILHKCLTLPGVESLAGAWVLSFKETECCRTVMSLFSNSLNLTVKNGDPIYGELSLLFFQEWLQIVPVAEHFVNEGLFRLLYESPISRQVQRGEVDATSNLRLYHIWTKGIIGIVLQLMKQLKGLILADAAVWVSYFSKQITRSMERWTDIQYVSFSIIEETSQLLLILYLVKLLCRSDDNYSLLTKISNDVVWDPQDLISSIQYLLDHQKYLASKLAVLTIDEQRKFSKDRTGTLLVDKVVQDLEELRDFLQEV